MTARGTKKKKSLLSELTDVSVTSHRFKDQHELSGKQLDDSHDRVSREKGKHGSVAAHRVGAEDLEVGLVRLQQLAYHLQEALHEEVDALAVAGHQQLVQGLHGDAHVAAAAWGAESGTLHPCIPHGWEALGRTVRIQRTLLGSKLIEDSKSSLDSVRRGAELMNRFRV